MSGSWVPRSDGAGRRSGIGPDAAGAAPTSGGAEAEARASTQDVVVGSQVLGGSRVQAARTESVAERAFPGADRSWAGLAGAAVLLLLGAGVALAALVRQRRETPWG